MPLALQHDSIRNFPGLGLVLQPGVPTHVSHDQAVVLEAYGITILPDPTTTPIPFHLPPDRAHDEEHDR